MQLSAHQKVKTFWSFQCYRVEVSCQHHLSANKAKKKLEPKCQLGKDKEARCQLGKDKAKNQVPTRLR